jgi:S1-C subfamily serine protease
MTAPLVSMQRRTALAAGLAMAAAPALALTPTEIFEQASPSVWAVRALDEQERPFSHGSAVVVAPGQLVTNCHVLAKAKAIQVRRENVLYEAKLEHADVERDLCLLSAKNLNAPAIAVAKMDGLKVGQRVFAIGNPQRLSLTLSEGLISGLRGEEDKPLIQTTAPLSPGSSGGGLFDESGRLVGITTFGVVNRQRTTQSLNFALPAEWIPEVAQRSQQAAAARSAPPDVKTARIHEIAGMPAVGATWKYSFRDHKYSNPERSFTIRIASVATQEVREAFRVDDGEERSLVVQPDEIRFSTHRLTNDYSILQLAPYYFAGPNASKGASTRPTGYPGTAPYNIGAVTVREDDVQVPAGTFKAMRLDVTGTNSGGDLRAFTIGTSVVSRFHYTAWYAPEVNRYVSIRHQTWDGRGIPLSDERIQLIEHRPR